MGPKCVKFDKKSPSIFGARAFPWQEHFVRDNFFKRTDCFPSSPRAQGLCPTSEEHKDRLFFQRAWLETVDLCVGLQTIYIGRKPWLLFYGIAKYSARMPTAMEYFILNFQALV